MCLQTREATLSGSCLGIGQKPGRVALGTLLNLTELPCCPCNRGAISPTLIYSFLSCNQGPGMLGWD